MAKICDHTSVGIIVRDLQNNIAVIKRKNYPVAYALPAGHCDGDSYENAAKREAKEETGVEVLTQEKVWEGTFLNPCRRQGGDYNNWQIFEVKMWDGTPQSGFDAQELIWLPASGIVALARHTARIANKYLSYGHAEQTPLAHLLAIDAEWRQSPGLELVWCLILTRIKMIRVKRL